jgi:hypothetical protein
MNILRTARVSAYSIAAIAGAMSYGHQVTLLGRAHVGIYAYAVPVTVDVLAFVAAMVRNSDVADDTARRAATWTLLLAGTASVAANIAVGENLVQRLVGFWTVAAYLVAEWFVSRLKARPVIDEVAVAVADTAAAARARRSEAGKKAAATRAANAAAAANATTPRRRRPKAAALASLEAAYAAPAAPEPANA